MVVLPAPVDPTRATISPGATSKSTPLSTSSSPNPNLRSSTVSETGVSGERPMKVLGWLRRALSAASDVGSSSTSCSRSYATTDRGKLFEEEADHAHREREDAEQRHRLDHVARADRTLGHPPCSDGEDGKGAQRRECVDGRLEGGAETSDMEPFGPKEVGFGLESMLLGLLEPERLDDQRSLERLVGDRRHAADRGLCCGGRRLDPAGVDPVHEGEGREQGDSQHREVRIDERQVDRGEHDDHDHAEREGQGLHGECRTLGVGISVREQPAGRAVEEEPERFIDVSVGERVEPGHLHLPGRHRSPVAAEHDAERSQDRSHQDRRGGDGERSAVDPGVEGRNQDVVGDSTEHDRSADGRDREDRRSGDRDDERARVGADRQPEQREAALEDGPVGHVPASLAMTGATASMASAWTHR